MKKLAALFLSLALALPLGGCSGGGTSASPQAAAPPAAESAPVPEAGAVELVVFAAASMTETMNQIAALYETVAPDVTLTFTFDSSGTLKTQIEEGADCDLFLSAAQKQMNQLDSTSDPAGNDKGLDFVLQGTRVDLLENQVVLVVPEGNPAGVSSFEDVSTDKVALVALGNSDVPVGQYAQELFTTMGVWDGIQSKITFGSNVKEVTTWVSEGAVDCGVVYSTDANAAGLAIVTAAPEGLIQTPVIYPAAVLNTTKHQDEAKAFLAYLQGPECTEIFKAAGFSIPA